MGNQMETVKDSEGNRHLIFDESSLYDDSQMGEKLSDFDILQVLSENDNENENENEFQEESPCFVSKVRSLNNQKIYAMKKIELNKVPNKDEIINKIEKLKELNNPHIVKYYKSFKDVDDENILYVIMEFMNNADIKGFIKAHQILKDDIKEEEIWNILLQCSSALDYLHGKDLGNYGIRFNNIFMNNEQNSKIGVLSDLSKNNNGQYNAKDDIYELGKYFNNMIFAFHPIVKENIDNEITVIRQDNSKYSPELVEIINQMVDNDSKKRPNSSELYQKVKQEYVKKYAKNESIKAVLRCLYAYPALSFFMFNNEQMFKNNKDKYYINYWYTKAIKAFKGEGESQFQECVDEFRRAIASENSKLDGNREIDPIYLTAFLLEKMHKELNKPNKNSVNQNITGKYVINSIIDGEEEDRTNKEQMHLKFKNYSDDNINSEISNLFFGCVKTKVNCQTCKTGNYSFSNFCFVFFDLSSREQNKDFDLLEDGFAFQYNHAKYLEPDQPDRVYCPRCLTYQKHAEFNRYFNMNHQLIICFIRGNECKNQSRVKFNDYIDLSPYLDVTDISKFHLVGFITRSNNNQFDYYSKDPKLDKWHQGNRLIERPNIQSIKDQIIMLFYNDINAKQKLN